MMPKQLFLIFVIFLVPIYHNESHAKQWKQYLILFIFEFFDILMILHKHITNLQQLYNTNTTKQYSSKYYHLSNFHKHIRNTNLDLWWLIMGRRLGLEWSRDGTKLGLWQAMAPPNLLKKKYIYIDVLILAILFYKVILCPLNNIINSFKSNNIVANFFTIFLQSDEIANSISLYLSSLLLSFFYLLITLTTSLIYKTNLYRSHFSKGHKKNYRSKI